MDINESLLYGHNNWKEHEDKEDFLMRKYRTFCEKGNTEIKKDEWRNHILSEDYLESTGETYCELWKMSYYNSIISVES